MLNFATIFTLFAEMVSPSLPMFSVWQSWFAHILTASHGPLQTSFFYLLQKRKRMLVKCQTVENCPNTINGGVKIVRKYYRPFHRLGMPNTIPVYIHSAKPVPITTQTTLYIQCSLRCIHLYHAKLESYFSSRS